MSLQEIVSILSPLIIVMGTGIAGARWFWRQFSIRMDAGEERGKGRTAVLTAIVERIEAQTKITNGRVSAIELQQAEHRGILMGRTPASDAATASAAVAALAAATASATVSVTAAATAAAVEEAAKAAARMLSENTDVKGEPTP